MAIGYIKKMHALASLIRSHLIVCSYSLRQSFNVQIRFIRFASQSRSFQNDKTHGVAHHGNALVLHLCIF